MEGGTLSRHAKPGRRRGRIAVGRRERTALSSAVLRRSWASIVAIAFLAFVLVRLAWQSGGYFPAAFTWAGAVAFGVLGVVALAYVPRYRISMSALLAFASLAGLAAWTGLSSAWSLTPDTALLDMQRDMLYVALFALGLLAAGSGRFSRHLVWVVLAVILVVAGAGLLSRLQPSLVQALPDAAGLADYRLSYPLGYWNAFGALAAMGTVLGLGLAADPRSAVVLRSLAAGASVVLAVAMYLSLSRGAWLALMLGVVALVALSAHRGSLLLTGALVAGAVILGVTRLQAYPALIDDPTAGSGQAVQGDAFTGQLILIVAIVLVVQGVVAAGRASPNLMRALRRTLRPVLIGLGVILALVVVAGYVVRAGAVEGRAAGALTDATGWIDRQWNDFLQPTSFSEGGTARLTSAKGTRSDIYRVAFDGFEAHPLRGDGSGAFEVRWAQTREVSEKVRDAHSIQFETLGELGGVGALLLLGFLVSIIVATVRSRVRTGALSRSQTAAVGGTVAVWIGHSIVDWDWQMPALTGTAIVLAATVFPEGRRRRRASAQ